MSHILEIKDLSLVEYHKFRGAPLLHVLLAKEASDSGSSGCAGQVFQGLAVLKAFIGRS